MRTSDLIFSLKPRRTNLLAHWKNSSIEQKHSSHGLSVSFKQKLRSFMQKKWRLIINRFWQQINQINSSITILKLLLRQIQSSARRPHGKCISFSTTWQVQEKLSSIQNHDLRCSCSTICLFQYCLYLIDTQYG